MSAHQWGAKRTGVGRRRARGREAHVWVEGRGEDGRGTSHTTLGRHVDGGERVMGGGGRGGAGVQVSLGHAGGVLGGEGVGMGGGGRGSGGGGGIGGGGSSGGDDGGGGGGGSGVVAGGSGGGGRASASG